MTKFSPKPQVVLLILAILLYAVTFSYLTLTRYWAFEARALDMGNLDQAVWNTAHGRPFHLTNQPGTVNRLSLHVEPILLPISLFYWIYSGPPTLLVLQATMVALGAWPLFALARFKLRNDWIALLFALVWLLNPTLQAANWLEFHPVTLAPTFLVATFYCLVTGKLRWYALFAVLAASCKEEIALLVFMIGLYAFGILRRRRLGLITMSLALLWALTAVLFIQNTFAAGNIHWGRYAYLGETPTQIVLTLLTQPGLVWTQLVKAQAARYLTLLLLPVGFTALLAPEILLLALPSLAINLLADYPPMHQVTTLMYAAPIVPFVLIGAVWGTGRAQRAPAIHNSQFAIRNSQFAVALLVFGFALYAQARYGYLPSGSNFQHFTITDHHRRAAALIQQIPQPAKVTAQDKLNPHVSSRETVYIFPRIDDADTVFVDVTGPAWPQHPNDLRRTVDELLAGDWGITAAEDGYLVLGRGATAKQLPTAFFSAWQRPAFAPLVERQIDFADTLRLLDYRVATDAHGELITQLYWQLLKPIDQAVRFYVGYWDSEGNVLHDTQFYPPVAQLWYPTSQWEPGVPILVQTLPWTLAADRFVLAVGLYTGAEWQNAQRLPVSQVQPPLPRLPGEMVRLGGYQRTAAGQWTPIPLQAQAPTQPLAASFGEQLVLTGATVTTTQASAGETVVFTLFWRAQQPPAFDYNLFAHLLDAAGNKVTQLDWQPADTISKLPATAWVVDQPVVDTQQLVLPPTLPSGHYRLVVGWYNWQDGTRLPVTSPQSEPGDVVPVAQIEVK